MFLCCSFNSREALQSRMQAGRDIHSRFDGRNNICDPMLRQEPALIDNANDQRASALCCHLCD
jgi:hypothetical protein